jgi:hypothetical protein
MPLRDVAGAKADRILEAVQAAIDTSQDHRGKR